MEKYATCPISSKRVNERMTRLNGFFIVSLAILFIFTQHWFIPLFLVFDFLMRSTRLSKLSPIGFLSRSIVKILPLKKKLINAGPKIFAAQIGLFISSAILITSLSGLNVTALILTGIIGLFSFLEAAFGLCVACEIYPYFNKLFYKQQ